MQKRQGILLLQGYLVSHTPTRGRGLPTARRAAWAKADNKLLFECYVKSEPESRGYRKRLVELWRGCGPREDLKNVSE